MNYNYSNYLKKFQVWKRFLFHFLDETRSWPEGFQLDYDRKPNWQCYLRKIAGSGKEIRIAVGMKFII